MQKVSNFAWKMNREYNEIMKEPDPVKKAERLKVWREQLAKGKL